MKRIFITSSGTLKRKSNTISFITREGTRYLPYTEVESIYVLGEVTLNKRFLHFLSRAGIPLHFFTLRGHYLGSYLPVTHHVSGYLLLKQVEHYNDPGLRLTLARAFVEGSIRNMALILRENGLPECASKLRTFLDRDVSSVQELLGVEGNAREMYYSCFDQVLGEDFAFEKRTRRPPQNRLNSLISLGNSLLYVTVLDEIRKTHLDPRIGFLHTTNFRRFSLNLDVAEVFKPVVVDRLIISMINRGSITPQDFEEGSSGLRLTREALRKFLSEYDRKLSSTITVKRRKVSYTSLIRMEGYKLERHVMGEMTYRPYVAR
ncbi:type I-B CRISPR-associated endonuclease Cas1b [Metallosphaera javensis (ex Sakai et al. 2022)]|uniref:type I-B CRISPR-associated endonuclease Cas1b n=1 Tax=Metallosphaera javensis (ex Sakai et al. 2022) TaxID=2775498 RepID=UPI00258B5B22|nr:MAG: CRISPR-associated endonuclease Cas1 [Metallosphaera javensis (ex Sakai et al. 2022)]